MKNRLTAGQSESYDALSIILHWVTAFLVIAIFALALAPGIMKSSIALHNTLGLLLLVVVPLRAVWRFMNGGALRRAKESRIPRLAATVTHGLLYAMLLVVPVLGLFYVDAKSIDFRPFGIHLPELVHYDRDLAYSIYAWKKWIAYAMLFLILFHAAAAIAYHHLFRKDRVLRSMLLVSPEEAPASEHAPASNAAVSGAGLAGIPQT